MKVAIVLATYKPPRELLRLQLASLMAQTHAAWTLAVHDDASMDLADLRAQVEAVVPAGRFVLAQAAGRGGAVANFSSALSHVPEDCELIAFCDQDDEWEPTKVARMVAAFEGDQAGDRAVMAVHSDLSLVDGEGRPIASSCWAVERRDTGRLCPRKVIFRNPVTGCALMFRRELLARVVPIPAQPATAPFYYHDAWVALAALERGRLLALAEPLVRYRQHGANAVGAERASGAPSPGFASVKQKCLKALATRQRLEQDWRERSGVNARLFTAGFDLGARIFFRTLVWSLTASRGYLRIGLQLAVGKFLWDCGFRLKEERHVS